ncbi:MAG: nuclear transport factor 2 family protein [Pyrinomonadaceae bacterium]
MARSAFLLACLLSLACALQAQTATDAGELRTLLNQFLDGAGRNDAAVHDRFWADDLIYTRSAGVRVDKAEVMRSVRSSPAAKSGDPVSVYTAEDVRVQLYGDAAVVAFRLISTTTRSDGSQTVGNNLNTGTFVKRKGKWQVVAWQSTIVPTPGSETKVSNAAALPTAKTLVLTPTVPAPTPGRTYLKGSRGGCYYLTASGKKTYVDHSYCK